MGLSLLSVKNPYMHPERRPSSRTSHPCPGLSFCNSPYPAPSDRLNLSTPPWSPSSTSNTKKTSLQPSLAYSVARAPSWKYAHSQVSLSGIQRRRQRASAGARRRFRERSRCTSRVVQDRGSSAVCSLCSCGTPLHLVAAGLGGGRRVPVVLSLRSPQ